MKHRMPIIGALMCAACLALALVGCSQETEYTPETLTPTVTSPTIGKDGTLRVGVGGGAPFVVSTSTGSKTAGLDVDMAAAIADQLGLKLEIVSLGTSDVDADAALAKGEVDIVMSATSSDANDAVWVSDPYTQTGIALFAPEGSPVPTANSNPKIAAQSASTSAWAVSNAFGENALVANSDLLSALSSIETKSAAYVAADAVIGSYAALGQNVDIQPIAVLGTVGGYGVAVSASNPDLQKAISDALSQISNSGVAGVVCSKWLGASIDLSALPVIEVSASKAAAVGEGASDENQGESSDAASAEQAQGASTQGSSTESADGVAPKTEAGANAVVPAAGVAA